MDQPEAVLLEVWSPASNKSIAQQLLRHADSQATPQIYSVRNRDERPAACVFTSPRQALRHTPEHWFSNLSLCWNPLEHILKMIYY